jgi:hypothetical protein
MIYIGFKPETINLCLLPQIKLLVKIHVFHNVFFLQEDDKVGFGCKEIAVVSTP